MKNDLIDKFNKSKYWLVSPLFKGDPNYLLVTTGDDGLHLLIWQDDNEERQYRFTTHNEKHIASGLVQAKIMSLNYSKLCRAIDEAISILED